MSTKATISFYDEQEEPILCVLHQYSGSITGVGYSLANWLNTKKVVYGIGHQTMEEGFANDMGCLAAQYVAEHKTRIGSLYIFPIDSSADYDYSVKVVNGKFLIKVNDFFEGSPNELLLLK